MRARTYLPRWVIVLLSPLFRYSVSRDAWVLRLVGGERGPVLKAGKAPEPAAEARWHRDAPPAEPREPVKTA